MRFLFIIIILIFSFLTLSIQISTSKDDDFCEFQLHNRLTSEFELLQELSTRKYDPDIDRVPQGPDYDLDDLLLYIREQCTQLKVHYGFVLSILREENSTFFHIIDGIYPESQLNNVYKAISKQNENGSRDYGLWQLNGNYLWEDFIPRFWHYKTNFDYTNPYHNTYIAIRHIRWLYDTINQHHHYRQLEHSVYWEVAIAYNSGIGRTITSMKVPSKTLDYAANVMGRLVLY